MIHVVYRWHVLPENRQAFLAAWEKTTLSIRGAVRGARGSFCIVGLDNPTEVLTVAKWDEVGQWREFIKTAKSETMREMHTLATQISHDAYEHVADHTI